jgi:hypothetical protein
MHMFFLNWVMDSVTSCPGNTKTGSNPVSTARDNELKNSTEISVVMSRGNWSVCEVNAECASGWNSEARAGSVQVREEGWLAGWRRGCRREEKMEEGTIV